MNIILFIYFSHLGCEYNFIIYLFQTSVAVNIILFIYFSHLGCEYNFIIYLFISDICCCEYNFTEMPHKLFLYYFKQSRYGKILFVSKRRLAEFESSALCGCRFCDETSDDNKLFPLMFTNNFSVYSDAALFLLKCVCVCVCVLHKPARDKITKVSNRVVLGKREAGGLSTAHLDSTQTERQ